MSGSKLPALPKSPPPTNIVGLRIHPIKSCRGFTVQSAKLLKSGFDLDRQWMFATVEDNATRTFITIRQEPRMTLIHTSVEPIRDVLIISIKDSPSATLEIPAHPTLDWLEHNTSLIKHASIWADDTDGWEYPETWTAPFAAFLGKNIRLIYKGPTPRILRGNAMPSLLGRTESLAFADLCCVQVANQNSMDDLNGKLRERGAGEITIERFRPNIIVSGAGFEAWDEDSWKTLRISPPDEGKGEDLMLDVPCRCLRCQVPNVDPETGVKDKEEPWNTLMRFRNVDAGNRHKPCFGMLCVPREEGIVRVGDVLEVTEVTGDHEFMKNLPAGT